MERDDEVQEYYKMSLSFLEAAHACLSKGLHAPAMANGIHALELAMKAALAANGKASLRTHYVGGLFGKHFRARIGAEKCRKLNSLLARYNLPRYPGEEEVEYDDIADDVSFIDAMVKKDIRSLLKEHTGNLRGD